MVSRKRSWVLLLIVMILTLPTHETIALSTSVISNQFTQVETVDVDWTINQSIPDSYEKLAENQTFVLYAHPETLAFKVIDLRSGYVWHSNFDEVTEEDRLNRTWTAFAQSGVSIDVMNRNATTTRLSITRDNHNLTFNRLSNGFSADLFFPLYGLGMTINVTLDDNGVKVELPSSSIIENMPNDYKFETIHLYPFFGATKGGSVPGYLFIPDGSGALIRFNDTTKATSMFTGRYYGNDLGMIGGSGYDYTINPVYPLTLPVLGAVHGVHQNAYLLVVESGAQYARLRAHPAGITTQFNFIYNSFIYNESFFQAVNRAGAGVTAIQKETNDFDIIMHYRFLNGKEADYVGMASSYRNFMIDKDQLKDLTHDEHPMEIRLEFLMGEKKRFLFWDVSVPMTTFDHLNTILDDLHGEDVRGIQSILYGWQSLGASSTAPTTFKVESQLGSINTLSNINQNLLDHQGALQLYLDPQSAIRGARGYSQRSDLAMSITNQNIIGHHRTKVNYYFNLPQMNQRLVGFSQSIKDLPHVELALDVIGNTLYSDFKRSNQMNRESMKHLIIDLFNQVDRPMSFYAPNDYAFAYTKNYYDTPISNSGYLFTTDSVPFISLVLTGYVNLFSTPLNFSSDLMFERLRMVDYQLYPSFMITHHSTSRILLTSSNWIFSSQYEQWSDRIIETYHWMSQLLEPVKGATIVSRFIPISGVSVVTYSNQKSLIVNYTNQSIQYQNVTVAPMDAWVGEIVP
ncbi:MAG: hypothetical protein KGZ38_08895 [Erysipelothrix sp.]|nr:hypothetical protein [Erysipelothrix sp.]